MSEQLTREQWLKERCAELRRMISEREAVSEHFAVAAFHNFAIAFYRYELAIRVKEHDQIRNH
jgi:hypothetical protein